MAALRDKIRHKCKWKMTTCSLESHVWRVRRKETYRPRTERERERERERQRETAR